LNAEECAERIRLVEQYSRLVTAYAACADAIKRPGAKRTEANWGSAEAVLAEAQKAWDALEQHISAHQCLVLNWPSPEPAAASSQVMGQAAAAALDVILVADDNRRFVDVNEAAASALGLPRDEIVGRRIDEFFTLREETIPTAWARFVTEGVQCGFCELKAPGRRRRFEYRAKANFAAGLHLGVLREQPD
jgi:PAS domain-containing protein